jgi:hypothetical protein
MMESDWAGDVSPTLQTQKPRQRLLVGNYCQRKQGSIILPRWITFSTGQRVSPVKTWIFQKMPGYLTSAIFTDLNTWAYYHR